MAGDETPAELVATMENAVAVTLVVGMPEIVHVVLSMVRPSGKRLAVAEPVWMPQAVMGAPLVSVTVGTIVIATPTWPVVPAAPAKLIEGSPGLIVMVTGAAVEVPTELVATTLNWVAARVDVGLPEMMQVVLSIVNELGKALAESGSIAQSVMVEPPELSVVGLTLIAMPTVPVFPEDPLKLTVGAVGVVDWGS